MHKIKFLGAAGTVTGSSYLLTSPNGQILIDLGMFQGTTKIEDLNYLPLSFNPKEVDAVILTHAHLDHCGRLPLLVKNGYTGPIFMTPATRDLTELTLFDAARIAEGPDGSGLYDEFDVNKLRRLFKTVNYHETLTIRDFKIEMFDAGHLLGSASLKINSNGKTFVFSGDLGNTPQDILKPTEYIDRGDFVVMESTYGGRTHNESDQDGILEREIKETIASKGVLLIPSFAMERTQTLLHRIGHLKGSNKIDKNLEVYVDSPMAIRATKIFLDHSNLFNEEMNSLHKNKSPFTFPGLYVIDNPKKSNQLQFLRGPAVIIAGSGMMNGGRILRHAANFLGNNNARLLLVGYQAEQTLGREIQDGERLVRIENKTVKINATVVDTSGSFSSHADEPKLINWLSKLDGVSKVFLTHGEDAGRNPLKSKIVQDLKITNVVLPSRDDIEEIN